MRYLNHALNVVLALASGACAPSPPSDQPAQRSASPGEVQVSTDRSSYRAGDAMTLTVQNGSADTVAFNPCTRTLEREQAGAWIAVPEPARICTMEAWILPPGERRAGPTELPGDLEAGRYRAVLAFTVESANPSGGRLEVRTAPFSVER
jgi:hypothetical protein